MINNADRLLKKIFNSSGKVYIDKTPIKTIDYNDVLILKEKNELIETDNFKWNKAIYVYPNIKEFGYIYSLDHINNVKIKKINKANILYVYVNNKKTIEFDYIKISNNRSKKYSIYTVVDDRHEYVYKNTFYKDAKNHLINVSKNSKQKDVFINNGYDIVDESCIKCKYLKQPSVNDVLKRLVKEGKIKEANNILENIKKRIYKGAVELFVPEQEFIEVFGDKKRDRCYHMINNANIDYDTDGMFKRNKEYIVIDQEWKFSFKVPAEYILWRFIRYSEKIKGVDAFDKKYSFIEIDKKDEELFKYWEYHFTTSYVGGRKIGLKNIK